MKIYFLVFVALLYTSCKSEQQKRIERNFAISDSLNRQIDSLLKRTDSIIKEIK